MMLLMSLLLPRAFIGPGNGKQVSWGLLEVMVVAEVTTGVMVSD